MFRVRRWGGTRPLSVLSSRRGRGAGEPCPPRPRLYSALFDPGRVLDEAALDFLNRGCLSPASTSRKTAQPVHFARRAPPTLRGGSTPHHALSPGTQRDMDRARLMNSTARPQRRQRHGIPTSAQSPSLEGVPRSRASPTSPHFGGQFASVRRLKHGARAQPVPFSRRRRAADLARLVRVVPCSSRRRSWATRPGALTWGRPHGAQSTIHAACAIGSPRTSSVIRADARVGNDQFLTCLVSPTAVVGTLVSENNRAPVRERLGLSVFTADHSAYPALRLPLGGATTARSPPCPNTKRSASHRAYRRLSPTTST